MPDRLLDTNSLNAAVKADARFLRYLSQIAPDGTLVISATVEGEARFGVARLADGHRKRELEVALERTLSELSGVVAVDRKAARQFAVIKTDLYARGLPNAENDLWIAATAIASDMILVTNDVAFRNISGLAVEDWSQD